MAPRLSESVPRAGAAVSESAASLRIKGCADIPLMVRVKVRVGLSAGSAWTWSAIPPM